MEFLAQLWLPILVSAVVVFFGSFIAWMVLPHHRADVKKLPDESALMEFLKKHRPPPGLYMWPNCATSEEMKSDEYKQRYKDGPWGSMTVVGAQPNFGRNLTLTFLFYIVVGVFVAYITTEARAPGAAYLEVFQVAGATAVLAYCAGSIPGALFFGKPTRFIFTELLDGFVYGLLTAGVFAWLWPEAAAAVG
ncbi:MAG: hypothetical protein HKO59_16090 [Phycisphaerales bacterium]|nr:hypothetical protein [Phycisphaerae bacterium]NNF45047.1 hypothetical protein [Phycisphaerales bacterium]NNM27474.1 hypothetical protein [Phycisphaerales bacterium]